MFAGYNYFLIVVTAVVCVLAVVVALYLLVSFQHPEDRNQAWFPKGVVILGISLAIWTVLLFPLDVANRQACAQPQCSTVAAVPNTCQRHLQSCEAHESGRVAGEPAR